MRIPSKVILQGTWSGCTLRRPKYVKKIICIPISRSLLQKSRMIKTLRDLDVSEKIQTRKHFSMFLNILGVQKKTLTRHSVSFSSKISTTRREVLSYDRRYFLREHFILRLTPTKIFTLTELFQYKNIKTLSIITENEILFIDLRVLKRLWEDIQPRLHRLEGYLKTLSRLKKIILSGDLDLILYNTLSFLHKCRPSLYSLKTFLLDMNQFDSHTKSNDMNKTIYQFITKLDICEPYNTYILKNSSYFQNLEALLVKYDLIDRIELPLFKIISQYSRLKFLSISFSPSLKAHKNWPELLENINLPNTLEEVSFTLAGELDMGYLLGSKKTKTGKNQFQENQTCLKFYDEWAKLTRLQNLTLILEWKEFQGVYVDFIIGWLQRLPKLTALVLKIKCKDIEEFGVPKSLTPFELGKFWNTLEENLSELRSLIIQAPLIQIDGFESNRIMENLTKLELIGKIKIKGVQAFLAKLKNVEILTLGTVSIQENSDLNKLTSAVLEMPKLFSLDIEIITKQIKHENLFKKILEIIKGSKAQILDFDCGKQYFPRTQFEKLKKYLSGTHSFKTVCFRNDAHFLEYKPSLRNSEIRDIPV